MNSKILFCVVVLGAITIATALSTANCPASSRIASCSPQCKANACQGGKICCTNICGSKSCVDIYEFLGNKGGDKYSNNKQGGSGAYCGNTKCSSGEKCEMDRATKRMKCVRG